MSSARASFVQLWGVKRDSVAPMRRTMRRTAALLLPDRAGRKPLVIITCQIRLQARQPCPSPAQRPPSQPGAPRKLPSASPAGGRPWQDGSSDGGRNFRRRAAAGRRAARGIQDDVHRGHPAQVGVLGSAWPPPDLPCSRSRSAATTRRRCRPLGAHLPPARCLRCTGRGCWRTRSACCVTSPTG